MRVQSWTTPQRRFRHQLCDSVATVIHVDGVAERSTQCAEIDRRRLRIHHVSHAERSDDEYQASESRSAIHAVLALILMLLPTRSG